MTCDAQKKLLIKDLDGSFFGTPSSYISESDYQYNGNPRHGFGDYRIPKTMQTFPGNGSRIPLADVLSHIGKIVGCICFIRKNIYIRGSNNKISYILVFYGFLKLAIV